MRNFSTIEEIVQCISDTRQDAHNHEFAGQLILSFHWQVSQVDELLQQLVAKLAERDDYNIHRFEYDYESETVYLHIMGESELHYPVQAGIRRYIEDRLAELVALTTTDEIHHLIRSIKGRGTFRIEYKSKLCKQADISFGRVGTLPSLVCEVS